MNCCWNCLHCDTFAGICFKNNFKNPPIKLEIYKCDEFINSKLDVNGRLHNKIKELHFEKQDLKGMLKTVTEILEAWVFEFDINFSRKNIRETIEKAKEMWVDS